MKMVIAEVAEMLMTMVQTVAILTLEAKINAIEHLKIYNEKHHLKKIGSSNI